jgi:hypothetical protein
MTSISIGMDIANGGNVGKEKLVAAMDRCRKGRTTLYEKYIEIYCCCENGAKWLPRGHTKILFLYEFAL